MFRCPLLRRSFVITALVIILGACQSSDPGAQQNVLLTQADADAYNATVANESEKLICKREKIMASIRTRLVCLTASDWLAVEEQLTDIRGRGAVLGN